MSGLAAFLEKPVQYIVNQAITKGWISQDSTLRVTGHYLASRSIAIIACGTLALSTMAASPVVSGAALVATLYTTVDFLFMTKVARNCACLSSTAEFTRQYFQKDPDQEILFLKIFAPQINPLLRFLLG